MNRSRLPRSVRLLAAAALAIVMVAVPGRSFRETYDNQNDAAYCLMAGVDDGATLRRSHDVDPEATRRKAQILRKHRLSVFGDGVHLLMGMPLGDAFRVRTTPLATSCIDEVVPLQASPLALEWKGWAFDPGSGRGIDLLVAVDQGGTIVGLGHGDLARPDVAASNYGFPTADSGWRLWSKNDPADLQRPRLYAVLADRSAVPLAGQ